MHQRTVGPCQHRCQHGCQRSLGSSGHPGLAAAPSTLGGQVQSATFTVSNSGWHLWGTSMSWISGWTLCMLHVTESSWPHSKGGHRDLEEIRPHPSSQLANHRARAGGRPACFQILYPYHCARLLPMLPRENF